MAISPGPSTTDVRARAEWWANSVAAGNSPLYEHLARCMADDADLLDVISRAPRTQPVLNLLFAAVHYLLLLRPDEPLATWYPSVSGRATPAGDPYHLFREFVLFHRDRIEEILATRKVQTNEVGRSAIALPVLGLVSERSGMPVAVVEVGASAGLNLLWDRFRYHFRDQSGRVTTVGDPSPVEIDCELRGPLRPLLSAEQAKVAYRSGIDLDPVDVTTDDGAAWIRSLVWPDQPDRHRRLAAAIDLARQDPPRLVAGDAVEALPREAGLAPRYAALCVLHTHVMNQLEHGERSRFDRALAMIGEFRTVHRISSEWLDREGPLVEWTVYSPGKRPQRRRLARAHQHGAWIEWLAD